MNPYEGDEQRGRRLQEEAVCVQFRPEEEAGMVW